MPRRHRPSAGAANGCEAAERCAAQLAGSLRRRRLPGASVIRPRRSPPRRGRHVGDSFMRAFRKPVHQRSKTPVLGLQLLHLEQGRRGQAAIALAPPIKSARRYVGCAANFGNRDPRIGFVQKVQNLVIGMLRVSHGLMLSCVIGRAKRWIFGPFLLAPFAAGLPPYVRLGENPLRLHDRRYSFRVAGPHNLHTHPQTAARIGPDILLCGGRNWMKR
jgi:hypothetical protein